jgi:hypothetical protein
MTAHKTQNPKPANGKAEIDGPSVRTSKLPSFISFLEDMSLLDEEDGKSYQQVFDRVVAETGAQSFLDLVAAKDLADKLFEERRYKTASAEITIAARSRASLAADDEKALEAAQEYLPFVLKFDRMINSSQAGRRALLKELRQSASEKSSMEPPSPPKTNNTN